MLTLAELNRRFYSGETARQFSETRHRAWPGFRKLLPHIGRTRSHSVLDVGCGNGRLATFLAGELESPLSYHGIDASAELLEDARRATAATCPQASFEIRDLVLDPNERLPQGPYSVIAAIAVLHHIPGAARRRQLVSALGERLAPGGVLVLTAWRFDRIERIASRVVPWAKANGTWVDVGDDTPIPPGALVVMYRDGSGSDTRKGSAAANSGMDRRFECT